MWLGTVEGESIGVAWEWTELRPGVVLLADPNSIITNVRFLDMARDAKSELHALISANRIANALAWQEPVRAVVQAHRAHPEMGDVIDEVEGDARGPVARSATAPSEARMLNAA